MVHNVTIRFVSTVTGSPKRPNFRSKIRSWMTTTEDRDS